MKKLLLLPMITLSCLYAGSYPNLVIRDLSGKRQTNVPVTFGQAFPKGTKFTSLSLASGSTTFPTQVDIKRKYDDGSIKHAVISTVLPEMAASQELQLQLKDNGAVSGTPVTFTATDVPDVVVQFTIPSGVGGVSVVKQTSLKDLIGSTPSPKFWLKGSVVTEAIFEGAPKTIVGLLPDDFLNVQYHVRYYPAAKVARVSVIVDNSWKKFRGNIKYAVKVLSGTRVLYQNDTVTHFYSARWKKDFFLGVDGMVEPQVVYDLNYLISTGLLPRYAGGFAVSAGSLQLAWTNWSRSNHEIMGNGPITPYFPQTGGREDIGLYPGWTARYLLSQDAQMRTIAFSAGDLSGSFSIHLRDSKDDRIVSIEKYPTATLLEAVRSQSAAADMIPAALGETTTPYTVDCAHQASFVYVPYLLSGDLYYLEELYSWANYDLLEKNYAYRSMQLGLVNSDQVRGQAWSIRTIADAAAIAPDDHPEKAYFDRIVTNNLNYYDTAVVAFSPLGVWGLNSNSGVDGGRPDEGMDPAVVRWYTSPWMTDFLSLSMDHLADLGYAKAKPIRNHLLKSAIGRLTSGPDFNPFDAPSYHLATFDVSGHQYNTWGEVWKNSFAKRTGAVPTIIPDGDCAHGYPYILRAALTAAIRDSLPRAKEAYQFIDSHLTKACFTDIQSWALMPNAGESLTGLPKPGTFIVPKKKLPNPYVSMVLRSDGRVLVANNAESDNNQWRIVDSRGVLIKSAVGPVCALPKTTDKSVRFYSVSTAFGHVTGTIPPGSD